MKVVDMKCPNCAAHIAPKPDAQTARCEYCGTTSAIQRRTRFFERVMPPNVQFKQMPVVTMPHTKGWATRIMVMVGLMIAVSVALPLFIQGYVANKIRSVTSGVTGSVPGAVSGSTSDYKKQYQWMGMETVLLFDVDGDGAKDIIGRARFVHQDDTIAIAAWNGETGKQLWESARYGNYSDTYQGLLAVAGQTVIATDSRGNVAAFSRADGAQKWKVSVREKVKRMCAAGDDAVAIELADESWTRLALADGAASAHAGDKQCKSLWHDADNGNADLPRLTWHGDFVAPGKFDGIDLDDSFYIRPDGPFIGLGHKEKGTRVPMVAVYDGELKARSRRGRSRKGKFDLVWSTEVPAGDPFAVKEGAPEHAAFSSDRIYVVHEMKDSKPHRVVAFQLSDGKRLWDAPLSPGNGLVLEGIAATPTRVLVSMWGRLEVLDAKTGKRVYAIGSR